MHYFPFFFQFQPLSLRNNFEAAALMQIKVKTFAQASELLGPQSSSPFLHILADFSRFL